MQNLIYKEECYKIIGACMEVHRRMGCGFLEPVYQECLERELALATIPFTAQKPLEIRYRGEPLNHKYIADFDCLDSVLVEIKAVSSLAPEHSAQLINYLNATGYKVGLLVNFGSYPKLEWKRFVRTRDTSASESDE